MQLVTITNDFHNSSVTLRCDVLSHIYGEATIRPSREQIKRAKRELCGIAGCECSGADGHRGPQRHNGKRLVIDCSSLYAD